MCTELGTMIASLGAVAALAMNAAFTAFSCSDIIGVVFDDENRNGIHDRGERGLPGIAIATVHGVWVVTDRLGRFVLPCAVVPGRFGSSYILKVDTRTLPQGYELTTRNPAWLRASQGRLHQVRFGAARTAPAVGRLLDPSARR